MQPQTSLERTINCYPASKTIACVKSSCCKIENARILFISIKSLKTTMLIQDTVAFVAKKKAGSPSPHYKCHTKMKMAATDNIGVDVQGIPALIAFLQQT